MSELKIEIPMEVLDKLSALAEEIADPKVFYETNTESYLKKVIAHQRGKANDIIAGISVLKQS